MGVFCCCVCVLFLRDSVVLNNTPHPPPRPFCFVLFLWHVTTRLYYGVILLIFHHMDNMNIMF